MAKPKKVESRYIITGELPETNPIIVETMGPGFEQARDALRKYREDAKKAQTTLQYRLWREVEYI